MSKDFVVIFYNNNNYNNNNSNFFFKSLFNTHKKRPMYSASLENN